MVLFVSYYLSLEKKIFFLFSLLFLVSAYISVVLRFFLGKDYFFVFLFDQPRSN